VASDKDSGRIRLETNFDIMKKTFLLCFWLVVACLAVSNITDAEETTVNPLAQAVKEEFDRAFELQREGNYKEASKAYKKYLQTENKNILAWNNLGICQQKLKVYDASEKAFKKAIAADPKDVQAYNNLASLEIERGDLKEAERLFKEAIVKDPEFPYSYNNLAVLYKSQGKLYRAVEQYKQALDKAPIAEFYYNLGLLYFSMQKYDDMLETFQQALKLQPNYAEVYYSLSLGHFYNVMGFKNPKREAEFKYAFNRLVELNPKLAKDFKENYLSKLKI
jgi:tetratricopeptide (TPR) repeat protein